MVATSTCVTRCDAKNVVCVFVCVIAHGIAREREKKNWERHRFNYIAKKLMKRQKGTFSEILMNHCAEIFNSHDISFFLLLPALNRQNSRKLISEFVILDVHIKFHLSARSCRCACVCVRESIWWSRKAAAAMGMAPGSKVEHISAILSLARSPVHILALAFSIMIYSFSKS